MNLRVSKIFVIIALVNGVVQMLDDAIKLSNWVSVIGFIGAALIFYFNAQRKGE